MAARSWTQEPRERQREAIKRWKPWEKSTGPMSVEGKDRISRNGWKGGTRQTFQALARVLREQRASLHDPVEL